MPTSSKKEKISVGEIIQKALTRGENWNKTTFEKFPQVLFWLRIVIAFILGLSWAFVKLEGQLGLISYAAASSLIVFLYYNTFLEVDVQDFGQFALISEGFMPALAIFVLTWSIFYTALYVDNDEIGFY
tara:strand:- start:73 stop:459 length:387 start_codon:yes stop_codon:yes gene_type:complete|eukprot:g5751.t1